MKNRTQLLWKNLVAYLLSWITASIVFPVVVLFFRPDYTYSWTFLLILAGLWVKEIMLPQLLVLVLFNGLVQRFQHGFQKPYQLALLAALLNGVIFAITSIFMLGIHPATALETILLMTGGGMLFGLYFARLGKKKTSPAIT